MLKQKWPKIQFDFNIPDHIRNTILFREIPLPVDWARENWILTKVYARKGKFNPYFWQEYLINLIVQWLCIYIVAPVRMGKTMISDIYRGFCIDNFDMGGMVIYPTEKLVKSNFKTRIIPSFKEIPAMEKHLTGKEDDITIEQIILKNSIWNTASAQNKNQLAQYMAQFVQGDEISKWRFVGFDPDALIDGRQMDFLGTNDYRKVYSSSPWEEGDMFYKAIYKPGTLIEVPFALCPWCHGDFEWSENHIKENLPKSSKLRKDPVRLKVEGEKAVRYECPKCEKDIPEDARFEMVNKTIWAAPEIDKKDFKQKADIIHPDGSVIHIEDRKKKKIITINWNRLIDHNWKFSECLAKFFYALRDPKKMRAFQSEDMARFYRNETARKSSEYIFGKRFGYLQYGPDFYVPNGVLVITCTLDTQDNGFYCIHRGWGRNMETWLLRHEYIEAPMNEDAKNKDEVLKIVRPKLEIDLIKKDGTKMEIVFGLIDRGGHRPEYVDYLCDHIRWLHPYVGIGSLQTVDYKKPMIKKSESKESHSKLYVGQTRILSERVDGRMSGKEKYHMPDDVTEEYVRQLLSQYTTEEIQESGEVRRKFITLPNDHYRDCENLAEGCTIILGLEDKLNTEIGISRIEEYIRNKNKPIPKKQEDKNDGKVVNNYLRFNQQFGQKRWLDAIKKRR